MPSTLGLDSLPSIPVEEMDDRVCEISFFVLLTIVNIIEALQNWGLKSLCFEMIIEPCALPLARAGTFHPKGSALTLHRARRA